MSSSPPAWTTVMEYCLGSLPKPWTGSSMCRSLLPGFSAAPSPGNTFTLPTPTLIRLHWLPVKSRISNKILPLTYKSLHSLAPQYLSDLLHSYTQSRTLCSPGTHQLSIPHTKLQTLGDRAFCVTAPTPWNTLPAKIRKLTSLQRDLKTHLFNKAY